MAKTCGSCEKGTVSGCVMEDESTVKRWVRCSVTGKEHEDGHPCDVVEKPRLCEVLGVDVGQRFTVRVSDGGELPVFYIDSDGSLCRAVDGTRDIRVFWLLLAINHPEKIERVPRLMPEEVQRCRAFGAKWVSRDADGYQVWLWETEPELQSNGVWAGGKSCAQTWARFFPSVRPGQLVPVEDGPLEGAAGQ